MSAYQIASGFNNAVGLANVTPQPASPGIRYPRQVFAASGLSYYDGTPYVEWVYADVLTASDYNALLTQFGLSAANSAKVTVKTMVDPARTTWKTYNAIISQTLDAEFRRGFWRNVVFVVRLIEALV